MMEALDRSHEGKESRVDEDENWNATEKRKRKSANKLMQHSSSNVEDEERETGKRRSSREKDDERRKSSAAKRTDSGDEEDYDVRRESRPKVSKKNSDDRSEKRSGDGHRERESESSQKFRGEERERPKKTSGKTSGHDSSQSRNKNKSDGSHGSELERDSRHSERKESHRERNHSSHEEEKSHSRRRKDETDSSYADRSDSKGGKASDHSKQVSSKNDPGDFTADKSDKSGNRDERTRSVEDIEPSSHKTSLRSHGEKSEKHKQHRSRDDVDIREKSDNIDDGGYERSRDRSVKECKESKHSRRSRTPERKHYKDSDDADRGLSDSDNEKKREKDGHRDVRSSKGKDSYKDDRSRDREVSKDHSRRSHSGRHDRDNKDRDAEYDYEKDYDGDKYHSRSTHRKSTNVSSVLGNLNEHSDTIEIRPSKNLDFGREGSVSNPSGRRSEGASDEEWTENRSKSSLGQGDDTQERYGDDSSLDNQGTKGRGQKSAVSSNRSNASQPPSGNNQGPNSINRSMPQGAKIGRPMRGGRGRMAVRDVQRGGIQLPMLGPPFGHLGLPPGAMQPIGPNMSPSPGPPIGPGVFLPGFPPVVWQGVPPALSPLPSGPRFPPGMPAGPNHGMYFNQPGAGRGLPLNTPSPEFNAFGQMIRGLSNDKIPGGWNPLRISGPPGKAPSRGEQNDYSQNFVDTGMRPQNFIRELELTSVVEDYPKLRELIQKKDEIVAKSATPPMYYKCDLREFVLSSEFFGTKFDVILVDPPWEEYVHRAPGVVDHMEPWNFEEIQNLKIEAIADTPSFIFLWVGDGAGLEQGRQCLKKWGFRRCEDICWVKTNKTNAAPSLRHDSHTLFQHSKEHCLMGIKGTVRRSTDGHIIHANIDTDVIIAEEPRYGSTTKPEDLYRIIEHFSLGRRRLELFGGDHNIRAGWLTLGKDLSSSNFNKESYCKNFADKDGKVWQGGGGRNPPLDAPHLVVTTPDIENLRPKSPPQKNQQVQSTSLSTTASSGKRTTVNSPQNPSSTSSVLILNSEAPLPNPNPPLLPWIVPPMGGSFKAAETGSSSVGGPLEEKFFDGHPPVFMSPHLQPAVDALDFDPQPPVNL